MNRTRSPELRFIAMLALCALALQVVFALRIALMAVVDPQSTSFQRSEIWRLLIEQHQVRWSQRWVDGTQISSSLKRAVIASEDAGFAEHSGVEWDALEKAWGRNQQAEARVAKINERLEKQAPTAASDSRKPLREPKVIGGSTITQQLAKNLFLAGERNLPRKAQEFIVTFMLEAILNKQRILEIYLNNVEWGEGVFGAEAAARHYFHTSAAQLPATSAARLAVMLPAPKRFEKRPDSPYIVSRAAVVMARMGAVELP
ncbi:MAG: transglycosylase domain-containing protein [Rhizobacter sp.]